MQKAQIYKNKFRGKGNEEWLPEIWRQTTQQRKEEEVEQRDGNVVKGIIGRFFFFLGISFGRLRISFI